jgi:predicted permease
MGMPIVLGRELGPEDTATSRKVAIINETMARAYFGGMSPLGRTFGVGGGPGAQGAIGQWQDIQVVGVVKDAKYMTLDEKQMPAAFYPHSQHPDMFLYNFVIRYTGDLKLIAPAIGTAVHQVDTNLPVDDISTLERVIDNSVLDHRLLAQLCTFFGALAAFLACIGIYGLMSYGVTRRTNEFGIRMALGAQRRDVLRLVLRETFWLVLVGVSVGLVLAPVASRLATSLLFGLKSYDPLTIASAIVAMIAVALFAGYFPARRATKVDPMVALRYE